jgi:hypothetical protein
MPRVVREFRVKDKNGIPFSVFEREYTETIPGTERIRKIIRYELETGEAGDFVDADTFVLGGTGERFVRVRRKRTPVRPT